ncbi:hypothetical protein VTK73DRAFT_3829 [Phialemonium thermophilum]|uniref:Uncharacterized protein n=1 Tax=Phialemonium thermophilum TaxID=223376 RepID=A0ABR3WXB2_9PEZI
MDPEPLGKKHKLGAVSGVYIPVCLNILSILMFLRFGLILGQVGLLGILGLLFVAYLVDLVTTLSLSAIASNGEVKGGGAYYLISRSLGPEFGGSIGILFYLAQVLNTALNVVGLIDCVRLNLGAALPYGYWWNYLLETTTLVVCTALCLAGSGIFARASNALLVVLVVSILSIPVSAVFVRPFQDPNLGIHFTGIRLRTLRANLWPHSSGPSFQGTETFRKLFGILFPATSGIFAGASMSGDLRSPSKDIPVGTLWAMLSTLVAYLLVILSLAASTTHSSLLQDQNIIQHTNLWAPLVFAGECATCFFSALMGVIGSAKLLQALARDRLLPGLSPFGKGTKKGDEPLLAIFLTYAVTQVALFANLNQIATFISMGYQMTFFVMNLACFLLKIGSAPNFRPAFKFFTWQTALAGSVLSAAAMFFIDETYATTAVCLLVFLFLLIHYLSPPKHWGDVSQNLIYHQVRKYLLRLKPEHIKFWRPQIILLVNDPRRQTRLIQFCNSLKKGSLYILGHVIVTDDFSAGVQEAKLQQAAWTRYISEYSRIKAFVQLTMSPSIIWGVRNLILSSGLGGMRPNIAVLGFYNMDELRASETHLEVPRVPVSPVSPETTRSSNQNEEKAPRRRRGDTSARLLEGFLPTDVIRTEGMMDVTSYMTILEDLALRYRLNVAVGKGFENLEPPRRDGHNTKKYIDLWPIQMSAELSAEGASVLTTNFDTYTLILQLGYILHTVPTWKKAFKLRVLVFVEYESEVEEERGRVNALLDKLRIEAEVLVFWLAGGQLATYEMIVHGRADSPELERTVNECLKDDEWWAELQAFRGASDAMTASQELATLANVMGSTAERPGVYNPHLAGHGQPSAERRRGSTVVLRELPKKPTVSVLARLGINMGIHTQNLPPNVFDESDSDRSSETDSDESSVTENIDADFNDAGSVQSEGDIGELEPARRPLLSAGRRRKTLSDPLEPLKEVLGKGEVAKGKAPAGGPPGPSYGTISGSSKPDRSRVLDPPSGKTSTTPSHSRGPSEGGTRSARSRSPDKASRRETAKSEASSAVGTLRPSRPPLSRQGSAAMKFSSMLVPETKITDDEGAEPRIMFADSAGAAASGKASLSRRSSFGKATGRAGMDGKTSSTDLRKMDQKESPVCAGDVERKTSNGGSAFVSGPPVESTSTYRDGDDTEINIPDLLASYKARSKAPGSSHTDPPREDDQGMYKVSSGSSYSTQGLPLSFNDLPSRAQYLILNELLRRQSGADAAVLLTTLPIPQEGTCQSAAESVRYLSDVEVLCGGLPPVLLVLSNNMTVTVSL